MNAASRFALLLLAAAWPVLVTGGAMWFPDIAPYVKGGHVAVQTVFGGLSEAGGEMGTDAATTGDAAAAVETAAPSGGGLASGGLAAQSGAAVSGVRSVAYSVTAYLTGLLAPRFLLLALLQAGVVAALTASLSARAGGPVWLWAGVLALSAAPLAASAAGPDVWAGIVLLAALLAFRHGRRLGRAEAALVLGALAFGVAAHASHVPLAAALALGVLLLGTRRQRLAGGLMLGGAAAGVAAILASSLIGFGEASLAPKRYPIVLARAIEDGPARWHLEDHCDEHRYTVCEVFPGGVPTNVGDFLWNEGGVRDRASAAQMEAIRDEEALILRRALAEYPFFQLREAAANLAEQLVLIAPPPRLGQAVAYAGDGAVRRTGERLQAPARLLVLTQTLSVVAPLVLLAAAAGAGAVRLTRDDLRWLILLALGLAANAAVCGVLSVPEGRYQARIAWVLPLVVTALLIGGRAWRGEGRDV